MDGLNIGRPLQFENVPQNKNILPLLVNSAELSAETGLEAPEEMAASRFECLSDSECTHDATCVLTYSVPGYCMCFEDGKNCENIRSRTQEHGSKCSQTESCPVSEALTARRADECEDDDDCSYGALCIPDDLGTKRCFCLETGHFCKNAQSQSQHEPEDYESVEMDSGRYKCKTDNDCQPFAVCLTVEKSCLCLENGTICDNIHAKAEQHQPPDTGTGRTSKMVTRSTTTPNNMDHGVIHNRQIHTILNSTFGNETATVIRTQGGDHPLSVLLHVVLPLGLLLLLGFLITIICLRRQRQHRLGPKRGSETVVKSGDGVMLLDRMNNINKNPTYFASPADDETTQRKFMVREICMDHVVLVDVVGEGAFGQVYRGELHCPETDSQQLVAVKVLKENVSNEIRQDFEREVEIMSAFDHDNILKLVGVVTQNAGQSPYMIFEYMVHGDLAELLRKNDPGMSHLHMEEGIMRLQKPDHVDIATQIANGMRYLTSQHFVHRDLATRNCLVGDGLVVKISDFGMSRDIYTCDYYKIGGSRMLPVRWMSPESVKYGRFTSESDAWAYGVVLWEIFSSGRQPYYGHSNEEVVRFLDTGILLQRPEDCPSTIYHIMLGCWKADPKERLSFEKIHKHLQDYHQRLVKVSTSQSQPTTPIASEGDIQMKIPENSSPDLPLKHQQLLQQQQQQQQQELPQDLTAPGSRPKSPLKATQSDPQASSQMSPSLLGEACRTSSQTLGQHRIQPKVNLQAKTQSLAEPSDLVLQVKLPPAQSAVEQTSTKSGPCSQLQPELQIFVSQVDSLPPALLTNRSNSTDKIPGTDSGFSSGEQHWNSSDSESTTTTSLLQSTSACDVILTSVVCTNPTEIA